MVNKTAIQWLYEQYRKEAIPTDAITELFREAERMEKEQMKYFMQAGYCAHSQGHTKDERLFEYWIETFKSE